MLIKHLTVRHLLRRRENVVYSTAYLPSHYYPIAYSTREVREELGIANTLSQREILLPISPLLYS